MNTDTNKIILTWKDVRTIERRLYTMEKRLSRAIRMQLFNSKTCYDLWTEILGNIRKAKALIAGDLRLDDTDSIKFIINTVRNYENKLHPSYLFMY